MNKKLNNLNLYINNYFISKKIILTFNFYNLNVK